MLLRTGQRHGALAAAPGLRAAALGGGDRRRRRPAHARPARRSAAIGAVAAVGLLAVLSPAGGMEDPRDRDNVVLGGGPLAAPTGAREQLAAPARLAARDRGGGRPALPVLRRLPGRAARDRRGGDAALLADDAAGERGRRGWTGRPGPSSWRSRPARRRWTTPGSRPRSATASTSRSSPAGCSSGPRGRSPGPTAALGATVAVLDAALEAVEVDRYQELRFYVERSLRTACQALLGDPSLERCEAPQAVG